MIQYERVGSFRHPKHVAILFILIFSIGGVLLLQKSVFVLRNVYIEGKTRYSEQQIAHIAGLSHGKSIFSVDQKEIAENFRKDQFLLLDTVYIVYPDTLTLHVREREPYVSIMWRGWNVILDETNSVMHIGASDNALQIPVVTGMSLIQADASMPVTVENPAQIDVMNEVVKELRLQGVAERIIEINVSNIDNLYLVTKEGLVVELGDNQQLEEKVGMMRAVIDKLAEMGMYVGSLDVSGAYTADYIGGKDIDRQYKTEPTAVPNELVGR